MPEKPLLLDDNYRRLVEEKDYGAAFKYLLAHPDVSVNQGVPLKDRRFLRQVVKEKIRGMASKLSRARGLLKEIEDHLD